MPIATITEINRLEHLTEYWLNQFEENSDELDIAFVGGYDEKVITDYPAVVLGSGNTTKTVHATHTFLLQFTVDLYIYHAEATQSHRQRSLENLQQVTRIVSFLEADLTLGDKIIFGYVLSERPGLIQPRSTPGKFIVSTLINYQATTEVRF